MTSNPAAADRISFAALVATIEAVLVNAGASPRIARILAENCAMCERDGALSHGVFRVPGYVSSLRSGWANGTIDPLIERVASGFIRIDARSGFAQPALAAASKEIAAALAEAGVAVIAIRDSHHHSSLWPDLEPFARRGVVGLTVVTGGAAVIPRGSHEKVLGTNPFAFATPVAGTDPLVMDFATSSISQGDLRLAANAGRTVPLCTGVGRDGRDTEDPQEILDEGGLLPFGGHKGAALSIMIEILASGLTGGAFSYRTDLVFPAHHEGETTTRAGQLLILIDPQRGSEGNFAGQVAELIAKLRDSGVERLPSDQRYRQRATAEAEGIPVTPAIRRLLESAAGKETRDQ